MAVPVLTYHSMNVGGNDYVNNDHVALREDLALIHALGWRIMPLHRVAQLQLAGRVEVLEKTLAICFDDGSNWDWYDIEHHLHGLQRGFAGILHDFRAQTCRDDVHATSFVIAGPDERSELDVTCMLGRGWWTDEWWREAWMNGIAIENHSWDHNHDTLRKTAQRGGRKGDFRWIDTYEECDIEIRRAADYIDQRVGRPACRLFAYPYGHCSDYLADFYLPVYTARHRQQAAFTTVGGPVKNSDGPWRLPRYVCGGHWASPDELESILRDSQAGVRT